MPSALRGAQSACQHEWAFCCATRHCVEGLALLSACLPQRLAALSDNTLLLSHGVVRRPLSAAHSHINHGSDWSDSAGTSITVGERRVVKDFVNTSDKNENQTLPCSPGFSASICCFFSWVYSFIHLFGLCLALRNLQNEIHRFDKAICCIQRVFVSGGYESSAIDWRIVIPLPWQGGKDRSKWDELIKTFTHWMFVFSCE